MAARAGEDRRGTWDEGIGDGVEGDAGGGAGQWAGFKERVGHGVRRRVCGSKGKAGGGRGEGECTASRQRAASSGRRTKRRIGQRRGESKSSLYFPVGGHVTSTGARTTRRGWVTSLKSTAPLSLTRHSRLLSPSPRPPADPAHLPTALDPRRYPISTTVTTRRTPRPRYRSRNV